MGRVACGLASVVVLASCLAPPPLRGPASEGGRIGFKATGGPGAPQVEHVREALKAF